MDMIDYLYGRTVKGIPLVSIPDLLSDESTYMFRAGSLFIKDESKVVPLGCVKEIYADPQTGRKLSVPKISNPCLNIHKAFGIECTSQDCVTCHKLAAERGLEDKLILLKK